MVALAALAVVASWAGSVPAALADSAPAITLQPLSQSVPLGQAVTFAAAAQGSPTPTVQWSSAPATGSFSAISGATSTTYTFTPLASDSGKRFEATFLNSSGSVVSSIATLTVTQAPVMTQQPLSSSGSSPTFAAAVSGSPTPSAQWQVSNDVGTTWVNVASNPPTFPVSGGATSSYSPTGPSNGTRFRVIFTNVVGSVTSNPASYAVATPASVAVSTPANQTVPAGASVSFTAIAVTSGQPLTLEWETSTDGGTTWSSPFVTSTSSIDPYTQSTTYTFTPTAAANGEKVRAFAIVFPFTFGTGGAATLTVTGGPPITQQPASVEVASGATATFTAAASGSPAPTVQWQVSTPPAGFFNMTGATSPTLSFVANAALNGNQYQAVFTSATGSTTTSPATLNVDFAPVMTTQPTAQTAFGDSACGPISPTCPASGTATFTAAASGYPAPTVQWQVSTNSGSTWTNVAGATGTSLALTGLGPAFDLQQYRAVFTNSSGSVTSNAAILHITVSPVFTTSPVSTVIGTTGGVTLTEAVTGSPTPTVQWLTAAPNSSTFTAISGATQSSYIVYGAAWPSGQKFEVGAANSGRFSPVFSSVATITIVAPPVAGSGSQAGTLANPVTTPYHTPILVNALGASTGYQISINFVSQGSHGTVTIDPTSGNPIYTPAVGYAGPDSFTYHVVDGVKQDAVGTAYVSVLQPAAPTAIDFTGLTILPTGLNLAFGSGAPVTGTNLTLTATTPAHGTVSTTSYPSVPSFSYVPTPGYLGPDSFTYTVTDPWGRSASGNVSVTVLNPPPPVAGAGPQAGTPTAPVSVPYQTATTINAREASTGYQLSVASVGTPSHGTVTISHLTDEPVYVPANGYVGPDSFTYLVGDAFGRASTGTAYVSVQPPAGPVASDVNVSAPAPAGISQPAPGLLASVTGTGAVTVTGNTSPAHGTVTVGADGSYSYVPSPGFAGADSFTYTVTDGFGQTATGTVHVTVTPPPAPTTPGFGTAASPLTVAYGATLTLHATDGSTGSQPVLLAWGQGQHGSVQVPLVLGSDQMTYTPTGLVAGPDQFTYELQDSYGQTVVGEVYVLVTNPPPPTGVDSSGTTQTGTPLVVAAPGLLGGSTGTALAVTAHSSPAHGSVTVGTDGTYTYTPNPGYAGTDSFTATIADPFGQSTTVTAHLSVDQSAPTISCASADGAWHNANVTVSCTASDAYPGLADPADASFTLSTQVAVGSADPNAATGTHVVCDTIGSCATAGPIAGNHVDLAPPTVAFTNPVDGGTYSIGASVTVGYTCADNGSGVTGCAGSVASGSKLDTSTTGSRSITVTATDAVGNVTTTTASYSVLASSISGTLTDSVTGLPVAAMNVRVWLPGGSNYLVATTTNAAGGYTLGNLAAGSYQLQFAKAGYNSGWYPGGLSRPPATTVITLGVGQALTANDHVIPLAAPLPGAISGSVTDQSTGAAISGATVSVFPVGSSTASAVATSGADGSWSAPSLVAGSYQVRFDAASHVTSWYLDASSQAASTTVVLAAGGSATVSQRLAPVPVATAGSISGTLTDSVTGLPVAGVNVRVWLPNGSNYLVATTTNAAGAYTLVNVAPGSYQLQFAKAGYNTIWYAGRLVRPPLSSSTITVVAGQVTVANDQMIPLAAPLPGSLSGVVTDGTSGAAIAGATVSVFPVGSTTASAVATSGADGTWSVPSLAAGSYQVRFDAVGHLSAWYQGSPTQAASTTVVLAAGGSVTVSQPLAPTPVVTAASITGTLTDSVTGLPIAGVNVRVWLPGGSNFLVATTTNAAGTFTITNLAPGSYQLQFALGTYNTDWYPGQANRPAPTTVITLAAGQVFVANDHMVHK